MGEPRTMTDLLAADLEKGDVNQRTMLMAMAEQAREVAGQLRSTDSIAYNPVRQKEIALAVDALARFLDRHSLLHSFTDRLKEVSEEEVDILLAKIRGERLPARERKEA